MEPDGSATLALVAQAGKAAATLRVRTAGAPSLALRDGEGTVRAELATQASGVPRLTLADADGAMRVALNLLPDPGPPTWRSGTGATRCAPP